MKVLDLAYVIALVTGVIATPFLIVNWLIFAVRRKGDRSLRSVWQKGIFPFKSTLFFAIPVIVCIIVGWISTAIARHDVLQFLDSLSDKCIVTINGQEVLNRANVLNTLRGLRDLPAHHSSPTRMIYVDISDQPRHLLLWVARDSSNSNEYWVFAPSPSKVASRAALKKDIGHVITSVLDQY